MGGSTALVQAFFFFPEREEQDQLAVVVQCGFHHAAVLGACCNSVCMRREWRLRLTMGVLKVVGPRVMIGGARLWWPVGGWRRWHHRNVAVGVAGAHHALPESLELSVIKGGYHT